MRWTVEQLEQYRREAQSSKSPAYQPKRGHRSVDKELLGRYLLTSGQMWKPEFRFHDTRMWRFDYCLPEPGMMIAVEFEGGVFAGGGHTRGDHYSSDCEKYAWANILGYLVVRVTAPMIRSGLAFDLIEKAIAARRSRQMLPAR